MKKNILPIVFLFLFAFSASSQVVIGTDTPAPSSIFHLESTDKGFLPPRMTEAQMNAIQSPVEALIIYCLDCPSKGFKYFNGVAWTSLTADPAPTVTVDTEQDGFTGTFVEGIELNDQTLSVTVTNASFSSAALSFDPSNITFTGGVTGITVSAVSPTSVILAQAGDLQKVTYTLTGTPVGFGTLTADLNIAGILTGTTTVTVISASDFVLAQIGNEADDPDTVNAVVTTDQLKLITPELTNVVDDNQTAYQDYIDNNPTLFDSPATPVKVQAMVDLVNASQTVLVQIGLEADDPDTVNAVVTTDQLGLILPSVTNIEANNQTAYQDYIDNNPSLFTSPATQPEVQAMVDAVNASQDILAQIGLEADSPDNVPSAVTTDELGQIIPTVTGIVSNNQTAYQNYIDSNPSLFDSPATQVQVQNMINQVNANQSLLANIGTDASNGNNTLTENVTAADLNALPTISGAVQANEARYLQFISENRPGFSSPATSAEVQAMIDLANAVAPGAPTNVTATLGAIEGTADVTFTAPASDGGSPITSYEVTSSPGGITGTLSGASGGTVNIKGLAIGTAYTFTVTASNAVYTSESSVASSPAVTPITITDAPTIGTATTLSDSEISVAFTPPSNGGGSPITSYTVTSSPGGYTATSSTSPIVVSGLNGGTGYTFTVTATNAAGTSDASGSSNQATTDTRISDAPSIGTATAGFEQATITFTAPAHDGGAAITSYVATSSPGGIRGTVSGPGSGEITVTGLTNGVDYTFTVTAVNENGTSAPSSASNSVTPNVQVGDLLQGGVVYYVAPTPTDLDGDGKVDIGLICAVEDQSASIEWILGGASQTTENGNTLEAIGTGQTNTTAMMNQAGYTGGAAKVAEDYSVTDNGVTYNDWFLPSLEELNEMYSQKNSIEAAAGVTPFGANYWSSSEYNSSKAKSVDMSSGDDSNTNKNTQRNVRAIRTFSGGTGLSDPDTGFD